MRVAITGAGGLVGLQVAGQAVAAGHEVVGVVRSAASARRLRQAGARAALVPGLEAEPLAAALAGADAVVHLAQIGREAPGQTFAEVNVAGTRALVEAARRCRVGRMLYFSGLGVARYGMARHCTNPYFLSKLACEAELLACGIETVVFRPSYVLGPGSDFVDELLRALRAGAVPRAGEGAYRLQPIALRDAADLVVAALSRAPGSQPFVFDLVGPEPLSFDAFLDRLAGAAGWGPRGGRWRVQPVPLEEALQAARESGFLGMRADDFDCLLSDETGDARPLEALLGRSLQTLDDALREALPAAPGSQGS